MSEACSGRHRFPNADHRAFPTISIATGALMGLLLAGVAAVLSERLDRRVTSEREVEADLGVPVLGNIPRITEDSPALVTAVGAETPGADAFRRLAAAALVPRQGYVVDSVAVTGATDKEGRTTAAVNMALAFAQSGRQVVLVAADRRNNAVDRIFGLVNEPGLNDFLRSRADIEVARSMLAQAKETLGIRVVSTGTGSPPPLSSSGLAAILAAAHERGYLVVFDSPPATRHADALQIASIVDAVYVVTAIGKTRRSELSDLRIQLLNVQADLAGAIINNTSRISLLPAGVGDVGAAGVTTAPTWQTSTKGNFETLHSLRRGFDDGGRPMAGPPQASPAPPRAMTTRPRPTRRSVATVSLTMPRSSRKTSCCRVTADDRRRHVSTLQRNDLSTRALLDDMSASTSGSSGSSGGHLAHLLLLKPWWENHDRFWVTFDMPDAHDLLQSERVDWAHYPTTRNSRISSRTSGSPGACCGANGPT